MAEEIEVDFGLLLCAGYQFFFAFSCCLLFILFWLVCAKGNAHAGYTSNDRVALYSSLGARPIADICVSLLE